MARDTSTHLRTQTLYSVYLRNHTPEGTFTAAEHDLPRIKALGADIVWLMPIHPIGEKNRKGAAGSPYAIKDYRSINPEYGTLEDFQSFVQACHRLDMRCIIDVVFNHTSPDSFLFEQHPQWFYQKPSGGPGNRVGEWYDIIDLDLRVPQLRQYLIDTLKYWIELGVDGFRCDVAPLLPLDFWIDARKQCETLKPDVLWLSESVEPGFLLELRQRSYTCLSDSEIFSVFDMAYDYDSFDVFKEFMSGKVGFEDWIEVKRRQEFIFPDTYIKLRFTENHDQDRSRKWMPDPRSHRNWTAFTTFERGTFLVFGGQEHCDPNRPDLFNSDPVNWGVEPDFEAYLANLIGLRRDPIHASGFYTIHRAGVEGVVVASYQNTAEDLGVRRLRLGIFTILDKRGALNLNSVLPKELDNWEGMNLIDGTTFSLKKRSCQIPSEPVIIDLV